MAEMLTAATGIELSPASLMEMGERVSNLERIFNNREGITRADDVLPKRLISEMQKGGPSSPVNLELMLDEFYEACGWDLETGKPNHEKIKALGLERYI